MTPLTESQKRLVEENLGFADWVAWRYAKLGVGEFDDLRQEARIGLAHAAVSFRGERGAKFSTFAKKRVEGAVKDYLRRLDPMSRRERSKARDGLVPEVVISGLESARHTASAAALERELERSEARLVLGSVLPKLSSRSRAVLERVFLRGWTLERTGRWLGRTEARAQQVKKAALAEARVLAEGGGGGEGP